MDVDIQYSINFLKRVNGLKIGNTPINDFLLRGEHSLWSIQQYFLLSHIKEFSVSKNFDVFRQTREIDVSLLTRMNIVVVNTFILMISFLAIMKLYICRPRILIFCSDILKHGTKFNPRLFVTLNTLEEEGERYLEIVHTVGGRKVITNFLKFRRLVFYFESTHILYSLLHGTREKRKDREIIETIDLDSFETFEKDFVRHLLEEAFENVRISEFKTSMLERILAHGSIRSFISIDDVRYINEILIACKKCGILSYIFQHSNFDYLIGLENLPPQSYVFPDIFLVWNSYWLHRVPEISSVYALYKDRLQIGGRQYSFTPGACTPPPHENKTQCITVLIPYEVNVTREHVRPYMKALLQNEKIEVYFLMRDDFEKKLQKEKYFSATEIQNPRLHLVSSQEKATALAQSDVVAGVYSGFLDESIEMCKPVAILKTDYPTINQLDNSGLAVCIDLGEGALFEQLRILQGTTQNILRERRERFTVGGGDPRRSVLEIIRR